MTKDELQTRLDDLLSDRKELKDEALDLLEEDKLDEAKEKKDAIAEIDKEIEEVKSQLEALPDEEEEEEKTENEEVEVMTKEERKLPVTGIDLPGEEMSPELREFNSYLRGEKRDIQGGSLKTDSGFVLIPEEVVTNILKLKELEFNLDKYVTVKSVVNGSGKYPVIRDSKVQALPTVEELEPNPELAVKPFFTLEYDIKTHRGYFRVSREAIEDAKIDVLSELKVWLARTIAATRNSAILNALTKGGPGESGANTKLTQKTANSVDDLKDVINLNVKPNYEHNVAIVSQSAWAALDKLRDGKGHYLIQPDIKDASVHRLLGARVEVLPDEVLGASDTVIFGNLKDAIVLFDRSRYQAGWTDYMHFGECLMVAVRQDVRILDKKSAIVIKLDLTVPEEVPAG